MRRASFMLTRPQMRARTKTVTRRLGWLWAMPGMHVLAVFKGMGIRPYEVIEQFGVIELVGVRRERLDAIDEADCVAEGFPDLTPAQFVEMFCAHNRTKRCTPATPATIVTRAEFKHLEVPHG